MILLEGEYDKLKEMELPILLFITKINPEEIYQEKDYEFNYRYQNVYYFPDLNIIKTNIEYGSMNILPNTIDLTDSFKDLGIPKTSMRTCFGDYYEIINKASIIVRNILGNILENNAINSWNELRNYMVSNKDEISFKIKQELDESTKIKQK